MRRVFDGTSPHCDLLSVRNRISLRAGFRLANRDFPWNAKPDLAIRSAGLEGQEERLPNHDGCNRLEFDFPLEEC